MNPGSYSGRTAGQDAAPSIARLHDSLDACHRKHI
jgi:hypothetical protein